MDDVDFGLVGEGCLVVAQGGDGAFQAGDAGEAFLGGSVFLDVCQARFQSFDHGGESVVVFGVGGLRWGDRGFGHVLILRWIVEHVFDVLVAGR
ncbi:hypothetical protein D3C74_437070 [compost metagenome]